MAISNQLLIVDDEDAQAGGAEAKGPRARTARLMLETASALMQKGLVPSVSEVAEAAGVSRATAYRYFPTQAALVSAVVDEALGSILDWRSGAARAEDRVAALIDESLPRIDDYEATFRAALKLSLDQWAAEGSEGADRPARFRRGHRVDLLRDAVSPLAEAVPPAVHDRLVKALALVFGVEALVVLKDICGADAAEVRSVVLWAAQALVSAAQAEARA